ncbi:hypothetical protein T492DRAFT_367164 [Pavlovales sp. CCMP2436]|nr:hypothetical protein T492DRAFT_367164 [Pavlovales sp. CCMP2436]
MFMCVCVCRCILCFVTALYIHISTYAYIFSFVISLCLYFFISFVCFCTALLAQEADARVQPAALHRRGVLPRLPATLARQRRWGQRAERGEEIRGDVGPVDAAQGCGSGLCVGRGADREREEAREGKNDPAHLFKIFT